MTDVFLSVMGQRDNLGDVVLRRGLLNALRSDSRIRIHALVGGLTEDYMSGLHFRDGETLYTSHSAWRAAALRSALRGRAAYGFNAGEVDNSVGKRTLSYGSGLLARAAKVAGRGSFLTGMGVRHPELVRTRGTKFALGSFSLISWRDSPSQKFAGGGEVNPDWALAEGSELRPHDRDARPFLAISLRGDRPEPSTFWYHSVRTLLQENDLRPIVVTQVRRDSDRARVVADELGADVLTWGAENFVEQEERVRQVYSRSLVVVGDRLHAVVMGATEGAVPLGFTTAAHEKIDRTLAAAGFSSSAVSAQAEQSSGALDVARSAILNAPDVVRKVEASRESLEKLTRRINELFES